MADADEIMKIRYQHYFNKLDECIRDLVIEMYDCGLVRTEELYSIAYGQDALTPDSVVYRISDDSGEDEANVHALSHRFLMKLSVKYMKNGADM